jgi:hypothetical protein
MVAQNLAIDLSNPTSEMVPWSHPQVLFLSSFFNAEKYYSPEGGLNCCSVFLHFFSMTFTAFPLEISSI